jgi:hypothetical protein
LDSNADREGYEKPHSLRELSEIHVHLEIKLHLYSSCSEAEDYL